MSNRLKAARPYGVVVCAEPSPPPRESRARHALMIQAAAHRRRRAVEEAGDRGYWLSGCPLALAKARALRAAGLAPLP